MTLEEWAKEEKRKTQEAKQEISRHVLADISFKRSQLVEALRDFANRLESEYENEEIISQMLANGITE